mgnify:FL=1|tara:strand:+ start:748 stop:1218 length:471 start_codon:yes stop_codon:yes gene_type:complete
MPILRYKQPKFKIRDNRSSCPVSTCLEIVGDNWSLVLIRDLFLKRTTFTEFINSPEKISSNILSDRINKLLKYKLIEYRLHPKNRKVKQYYLTESGVKLYPLIYDLKMWSKEHLDMEFHPLSVDWYKENEGKTREESINEVKSSYNKFKTKLLNTT